MSRKLLMWLVVVVLGLMPVTAPEHIRHPPAMDGVVSAKRPDGASFADPWLFGGIHPIVGIAAKDIRHPWLFGDIHPIVGIGEGADMKNPEVAGKKQEVAVLAGGCFWCIEAVFDSLQGVESVVSGYSGGQATPTYEMVCSGETGHAEVVKVTFDPEVLSYEDLLKIFFTVHDPTTLNKQGGDFGTQYRSAIFYSSEDQKKTAHKVISQITAEKIYDNPIVTEVVPCKEFYQAEKYHQDYFQNNPDQAYCQAVVSPKVKKFRDKFKDRLKK